jgi:hypothetical protein
MFTGWSLHIKFSVEMGQSIHYVGVRGDMTTKAVVAESSSDVTEQRKKKHISLLGITRILSTCIKCYLAIKGKWRLKDTD